MITAATGKQPYFVGKLNPWFMIRAGLKQDRRSLERAAMAATVLDTGRARRRRSGPAHAPGPISPRAREDVCNYSVPPLRHPREGIGDLIELVGAFPLTPINAKETP